jgi:hypothetical protein
MEARRRAFDRACMQSWPSRGMHVRRREATALGRCSGPKQRAGWCLVAVRWAAKAWMLSCAADVQQRSLSKKSRTGAASTRTPRIRCHDIYTHIHTQNQQAEYWKLVVNHLKDAWQRVPSNIRDLCHIGRSWPHLSAPSKGLAALLPGGK